MYVVAQFKIVFVAVNSPSFAPPDVAHVDNKTVGRDDTEGHPQSAPRLFWAKLVATVITAIAVIAILVTSFFIWFINLVRVLFFTIKAF